MKYIMIVVHAVQIQSGLRGLTGSGPEVDRKLTGSGLEADQSSSGNYGGIISGDL